MSLDTLMDTRRLAVCVGPGGVGKTTIAATLALREATRGRKVLVMTIDPAKRLAQALGIEGLGDETKEIDLTPLRDAGVSISGELHAAMFDQAESMDALMRRVSPDHETSEGILKNRVYRAMAGSLARSHAYLAMERLYEVMAEGQFDLVVLDTPPARNALDILDAPGRLTRFLEEGVVKWFVPSERKGIAGRILSTGGAAVTKLFGLVVGKDLLDETLDFFKIFYKLRAGFRERAGEMQATLRDAQSAFVLVSSADETHLDDARALARSVASRGVELELAVFNRSYERLVDDPLRVVTQANPQMQVEALEFEGPTRELVAQLEGLWSAAAHRNGRSLDAIGSLDSDLSERCLRRMVPWADHDVRDLQGLHELVPHLAEAVTS